MTGPLIVVGVSGSRGSAAALRWAAAEAAQRRGRLRIVLAWTSEQRAAYAPPIAPDDAARQLELASRRLAATVRAVLGPAPPAGVSTEIVEGMPERVLVDQSCGADLLVLGSVSGHLAGRPIGPVIRTCLNRAHCPVVVVSLEELLAPDPGSAPAGGRVVPIRRRAAAGAGSAAGSATPPPSPLGHGRPAAVPAGAVPTPRRGG